MSESVQFCSHLYQAELSKAKPESVVTLQGITTQSPASADITGGSPRDATVDTNSEKEEIRHRK